MKCGCPETGAVDSWLRVMAALTDVSSSFVREFAVTDPPTGVKYEDLAYTSLNGFAAVGANNGHNGTYGNAFYRNEEVVKDFAWRS